MNNEEYTNIVYQRNHPTRYLSSLSGMPVDVTR